MVKMYNIPKRVGALINPKFFAQLATTYECSYERSC